MTVMACALLWCLGLVESIPAKKGYQHVARDTGQHQPVSPDFVMQLRVSDNTTATLFAYKRAPIHPLTVEEQMTLTGGGVRGGGDWKEENRSHVDTEIELSFQSQQLKHHSVQSSFGSSDVYDEKGAMYFAVAVILFYGISIAMLVAASTLKRSHTDYELKGFLRSYARIDEERRSREKQKVRMVLQQKNLMHMLPGCNLAGNTALLASTGDRQQQQQLQQQNPLQQRNTVREQHPLQQKSTVQEQHPLQQKPPRNTQKRSERQQTYKRQREEEQQQETYQQKQKFQQQNPQKQERQPVQREQQQQAHAQRRSVRVLFRQKDGSTKTETGVDLSPEVDGNARKKTMRRRSTNDLLRASSVVMETAPAPAPSPIYKSPASELKK